MLLFPTTKMTGHAAHTVVGHTHTAQCYVHVQRDIIINIFRRDTNVVPETNPFYQEVTIIITVVIIGIPFFKGCVLIHSFDSALWRTHDVQVRRRIRTPKMFVKRRPAGGGRTVSTRDRYPSSIRRIHYIILLEDVYNLWNYDVPGGHLLPCAVHTTPTQGDNDVRFSCDTSSSYKRTSFLFFLFSFFVRCASDREISTRHHILSYRRIHIPTRCSKL